MAFGRGRGIYTANADTGKGTRLVTRDGWMPAWSPDGRKIAYSRLTGSGPWSKWCLWVVTVGGTGDRQLTTGEEMDTEPAWSPDGKWIAFNRIPEGHFDPQIFIITSAGTGLRQLTTPEAEHAAWSPDGKWIAFSSYRAGRSDIYAMPAAGGTAKRLTRTGGAWQPDWCAPR
jgi:TolB protein